RQREDDNEDEHEAQSPRTQSRETIDHESSFRERFGMEGRSAGLLTRGSPSAAFPARASGVVAEGISSYSGGTVPDFHRVPSPCRPFTGAKLPCSLHGLTLAAGARLGGRHLRAFVH